jgi:hypothetical protein
MALTVFNISNRFPRFRYSVLRKLVTPCDSGGTIISSSLLSSHLYGFGRNSVMSFFKSDQYSKIDYFCSLITMYLQ